MGYENDPYRDEKANHYFDLMRISIQIGRKLKQHDDVYSDSKAKLRMQLIKNSSSDSCPLDFEMDDDDDEGDVVDEDGKAGRVKERWKEEHRERRRMEKGEKWATFAGGDSEAEEGEDDEEIDELFKIGKKKNKTERSAVENVLDVENIMAKLEAVAEEDAELSQLGKPTINKLKKISHLANVLSKKQLHREFHDHGEVENWLEHLPVSVRAVVLKILDDLPIDLKQYDRREPLKRSGLKKSRSSFNKSTRFEDRKVFDEERVPRRPPVKKVASKGAGMSSRDDQLVSTKYSQGSKSGESSSSQNASRPKPVSMDVVVPPPPSKVDPVAARIRAKQMA